MAFDLADVQDQAVVEHPSDPSVKFTCRRSDPHMLTKLYRANKITRRTRKGTEEDVDAGKFQEDQWVRTVISWEGVLMSKKALDCTEENKRMIFKKAHNLAAYVLNELQRIEDEEMEYQEKN